MEKVRESITTLSKLTPNLVNRKEFRENFNRNSPDIQLDPPSKSLHPEICPICQAKTSQQGNVRVYCGSQTYCLSFCKIAHFKSKDDATVIQQLVDKHYTEALTAKPMLLELQPTVKCAFPVSKCPNEGKLIRPILFATPGRDKRQLELPVLDKHFFCSAACLVSWFTAASERSWIRKKTEKKRQMEEIENDLSNDRED